MPQFVRQENINAHEVRHFSCNVRTACAMMCVGSYSWASQVVVPDDQKKNNEDKGLPASAAFSIEKDAGFGGTASKEPVMGRDIFVLGRDAYADRSVLAARPGAQAEAVSPLDLPPAVIYAYECGNITRWVTDPVELARLCRSHPEAQVRVLATEHLRAHAHSVPRPQ